MNKAARPPDGRTWRIAGAVRWRQWDDEIAVYNDLTGDTHHLVDMTGWVFARLAAEAATSEALIEAAAEQIELPAGVDLPGAVGDVIALLCRLRLIESGPAQEFAP